MKKAVLKMEESLKDKKKRIDNNLSTTLGLIGGRFISLFTDNSIKNKRDMFLAEEDKNFSKYH